MTVEITNQKATWLIHELEELHLIKKLCIVMIIATLQQFFVSAQDLVVTNTGDSINCKITDIKGDYVYFSFSHQNEVRNTLISKSQVVSYQYNYFNSSTIQPHQITGFPSGYPHWRMAVSGGWSWRTNPLDKSLTPQERKYAKKLMQGLNFSFDASYFFNEMFGVGFKYDLFNTSTTFYTLTETVSINFAGPAFAMRFFNQTKTNLWFMNYGIGYMGYTDKAKVSGQPAMIKGSTVGLLLDLGYDFAISKKWSAGIQLSSLMGFLTEYDFTENGYTQRKKLEKDEYEGLNRLNISIGLRCNL